MDPDGEFPADIRTKQGLLPSSSMPVSNFRCSLRTPLRSVHEGEDSPEGSLADDDVFPKEVPFPNLTEHRAPLKILLVRHGESMGNVDPSIYKRMPDHIIPLTSSGKNMALVAGTKCREYIEQNISETGLVKMWISPFLRTRETARNMLDPSTGLAKYITEITETPLLVEQDWGVKEGMGTSDIEQDLYITKVGTRAQRMQKWGGSFYVRWPMGESCFDVCLRAGQLIPIILEEWRSHGAQHPAEGQGIKGINSTNSVDASSNNDSQLIDKPFTTLIIVSHGVTLRAFQLMWCQYPPEYLDVCKNPPNCSISLLSSQSRGWNVGYIFGGYSPGGKEAPLESLELDLNSVLIQRYCRYYRRSAMKSGGATAGVSVAKRYTDTVDELLRVTKDFYAVDLMAQSNTNTPNTPNTPNARKGKKKKFIYSATLDGESFPIPFDVEDLPGAVHDRRNSVSRLSRHPTLYNSSSSAATAALSWSSSCCGFSGALRFVRDVCWPPIPPPPTHEQLMKEKLTDLGMSYIEYTELRELFDILDVNDLGWITESGFRKVIADFRLDEMVSPDDLFAEADQDKDGVINLDDFLVWPYAHDVGKVYRKLRAAFDAIDVNGDGLISAIELARATSSSQLDFASPNEMIESLMSLKDEGQVTWKQFAQAYGMRFR